MNTKKLLGRVAFFVFVMCFINSNAGAQAAQTQGCIKVSGEVTKELQLCAADLAAMQRVNVSVKERDGVTRTYTGVPVAAILNMAGVTTGRQLRGENLAKYLLVTSADNYQVVFSLAELDSSFTDRVVILADSVDGKPLAAGVGPLRIIVPGEKKPARNAFEVVSFVIRYAKD